ncbi:MAG TPA: ribosome biogenesis GTPase Der [Hypericibacter adhaerens]|nr:ribosome biogenesis GTPase Der [Hypericibacter adhaerens]HWA44656.1 ribosome biogenesis GTPase Der [Hypericibacter adhaerens]
MGLTLAIVGRPNVGKSTLFNRLIGKRQALVDDQPGVTRDRRYGEGRIGPFRFRVTDTAGFEEAKGDTLEARMREQTERAVEEADLVLFLIDAREGVTSMDQHFLRWLRKQHRPIVLVANKSESKASFAGLGEAHRLGLGEPIPVSAEHGQGLDLLLDAIRDKLGDKAKRGEPEEADDDGAAFAAPGEEPEFEDTDAFDEAAAAAHDKAVEERPLQLAIVGRPNVGKSTLVNRLIGEERLLVGPEAGITRDSIAIDWEHRGRRVRLVDTAGMRRQAKVTDKVERLSVADTLNTIRFAEVVILVLDAEVMLEKQDLTVASLVLEEGRALLIAANKWDRIEDKPKALKKLHDRIEKSLTQAKGIAVVPVSGLTGQNLDRLIDAAFALHKQWNRRLPTAALNRWLRAMVDSHPAPLVGGRRLKPRYMTQIKTRPPTFAFFMNRPEKLPDDYMRYLTNGLRERFDLPGVPIRTTLRKIKNPYAEE